MNDYNDLPLTPQEARMARLSYERWERSQAESMEDFAQRRRAVDLASLVAQVIENELTESERTVIRMRYYDCLTPSEIADRLQINKATVTRSLDRAEHRLQRFLRYVVSYQYDIKNVTFLPLAVREALVCAGARYADANDLGTRLRKARLTENFTLSALSAAVDIPEQTLGEMEAGSCLPDAQQLLRLSLFYGIPADCLLKGEST